MTRPVTRPVIARDALGTLTKLGQGGQGIVYQAPKVKTKFADAMVFKEYKPQARADVSFDALSAMPTLVEDTLPYHDGQGLVSISAWPCALVETATGPVGFVMPAIPDSFYIDLTTVKGVSRTTAEFQHLLNPLSVLTARGITISDVQRYQLLREVAKALAFLHRIGVCVGDISPKNVLFSLNPRPAVYFIDCDAMRVNGVSALPQMETPDWEVPAGEELATIHSDTYKLGLLALRLLAGDQHTKGVQQLPSTTPKLLRQLITDTLTSDPDRRPLPEAWTYLLGHTAEEAQHRAPTPSPPKPAPLTHSPEPQPVVRSRPTTTPAKKRVAAKVSTSATSASAPGFWSTSWGRATIVVAAIVIIAAAITILGIAGHPTYTQEIPPSPTSSPTMSGHYIRTETNPLNGKSLDNDWYVTSCGDGCASVALIAGGPANQARLVNGQWTMDRNGENELCADGSSAPNSINTRYTWDPSTLAGAAQVTEKFALCGASSPTSFTNNIQLRPVA